MAFTRSEVRTILGDAHTEEIENKLFALYLAEKDKLKDQIDTFKAENTRLKADSEKLAQVQKELDELNGGEDWKAKFEKEHADFESYKTDITEKEALEKKKAAYSKLLTDEQINEKHIKDVIRLTDFSTMKLDKDGNLENVDDLKKTIGEEWSEYKVKTTVRKPSVGTPPDRGTGSGASRAREVYLNHLKMQGVKVEDAGKE